MQSLRLVEQLQAAAQIAASTEGSAVSDDSPTLRAAVDHGVHGEKASSPPCEDIVDIAQDISQMLADAKANLDGVFATGRRTTAPKGVAVAVRGAVARRRAGLAVPTRSGTALGGACVAREFDGRGSFISVGEGTTGSDSAFWADLGAAPGRSWRSVHEYDAMSTAIGSNCLLYGDFSKSHDRRCAGARSSSTSRRSR